MFTYHKLKPSLYRKKFCQLKCYFIKKWYIHKVGLGNLGPRNNLGDH